MNKFKQINKKNKDPGSVNSIRTKLLLFIDQEHNSYIKNCHVKLNNMLPKEIIKEYSDSFTVTIQNPVITFRGNPEVVKEQLSVKKKINNISEEKMSNNRGVLIFSKCINEIGKEFIDQRKKNVGMKKLSDNKKPSVSIDTELSFIETINNIKSVRSNKSSAKKKSDLNFLFPKQNIRDLFMDKEEKEAKNIQDNFNKLQKLANKFKVNKNEPLSFRQNYTNNNGSNNMNFYNNFAKFNQELFEILQFKGVKFDPKIINPEDKVETEKRNSNKSIESVDSIQAGELIEQARYNRGKKNSSDMPKNPFSSIEIPTERKVKTNHNSIFETLSNENQHIGNNKIKDNKCFFKSNYQNYSSNKSSSYNINTGIFSFRNSTTNEDNLDTNTNTQVNASPFKCKKNIKNSSFDADFDGDNTIEEDEDYTEKYSEKLSSEKYSNVSNKFNNKFNNLKYAEYSQRKISTYNSNSNREYLENISDTEFDNRISTVSNNEIDYSINERILNTGSVEHINTYMNSDKHVFDLIKCRTNSNIRYDSEISKGSDVSKCSKSSLISKNFSLITESSGEILYDNDIEFDNKKL